MIAIFLFYNKSGGIQSRLSFSHEFKHCEVLLYDGRKIVSFQFNAEGIAHHVWQSTDIPRIQRNLTVIASLTNVVTIDIGQRKKVMWKPFWVRSCNELCRYLTGIDVGLTLNPLHLYKKLLKYNTKRNFEILYAWRRENYGTIRRRGQWWRFWRRSVNERPNPTTTSGT